MRAGRGNPALQPWRECASHRSLCSGTDQIRPDQNRQTVHLHLYRAPYGDKWEEKDWDFAIDRIARHLKEERDAGFVKKNAKGQTVNRVESVAHLGSSNVDSEECWSMAVFARSYGLVYIDHQARV